RAVVEPQPRDVALLGGQNERRGRGAERAPLREADQALEGALEIEWLGIVGLAVGRQEGAEEAQADLARAQAHGLFQIAVDDVVLPERQAPRAGLAVGDARARQALELERDVLEHVA